MELKKLVKRHSTFPLCVNTALNRVMGYNEKEGKKAKHRLVKIGNIKAKRSNIK